MGVKKIDIIYGWPPKTSGYVFDMSVTLCEEGRLKLIRINFSKVFWSWTICEQSGGFFENSPNYITLLNKTDFLFQYQIFYNIAGR